jgi:protein-disulfide isomerase
MKFFVILGFLVTSFVGFAQKPPAALATSDIATFTVDSLSPEGRKAYDGQAVSVAAVRTALVAQMQAKTLLDLEGAARNRTLAQLLAEIKAKVPEPLDAEIQTIYDANLQALGNRPLAEVRKQIIAFLRREPEQKQINEYVEMLKTKYKFVVVNDVNKPDLKPIDTLFTIMGTPVSAQEFESKNKIALYDERADIIDEVNSDLESSILSTLAAAEAKLLNIETSAYIGREVTDRMREFSDQERLDLEMVLKNRLFAKYHVKLLLNVPPPIVQKISVDDDPARGPVTAPITVVMFSDFQCPACSRTHPILRKVLDEFPGKTRFVVRDFPLQNIHENAFSAALAAGAANAQGKFFEYADVLYRNQEELDAASLRKYAAQLGLNIKQFELDFSAEKTAAEVRKDIADGLGYGISGTPTIFVNGIKVRHLTAEDFRKVILEAVNAAARTRVAVKAAGRRQ